MMKLIANSIPQTLEYIIELAILETNSLESLNLLNLWNALIANGIDKSAKVEKMGNTLKIEPPIIIAHVIPIIIIKNLTEFSLPMTIIKVRLPLFLSAS